MLMDLCIVPSTSLLEHSWEVKSTGYNLRVLLLIAHVMLNRPAIQVHQLSHDSGDSCMHTSQETLCQLVFCFHEKILQPKETFGESLLGLTVSERERVHCGWAWQLVANKEARAESWELRSSGASMSDRESRSGAKV